MVRKLVTIIGAISLKNQILDILKKKDVFEVEFLDIENILNNQEDTIQKIKSNSSLVMINNLNMDDELNEFYKRLNKSITLPIVPLSMDTFNNEFINVDKALSVKVIQYIIYGGYENIKNLVNYISSEILMLDIKEEVNNPKKVEFNGIFHPDTNKVFQTFNEYEIWYKNKKQLSSYRWIGILTHRNNWNSNNIEVEKAIIKSLEKNNISTIPVFSYASSDKNNDIKNMDEILELYFKKDNNIILDGLINFQQIMSSKANQSKDIFEENIKLFKSLNIPVFRPIICHMQDEKTWRENNYGVGNEISWAYTTPEMVGSIEQIIVGCKDKNSLTIPIYDRIEKLTSRILKYISLRTKENKDKVIAMIIHSAPCSSVEATIGLGAGLDVFESCIRLLRDLKKNGYIVEDIPSNGNELHELIMSKKAIQDFRWTSVEDIISSDGVIYKMKLDGENGYLSYFNQLPLKVQNEMNESWGIPPGEGMVYNNELIITGLKFGKVYIMVQPKRGCYGAKCTGEVCKILHDPSCPMPHQYLATYRYIENIINADCIIHVGTDGSLEYLPGKSNALSSECYPDIVISSLPNIYIYNSSASTEGVLAKRRSSAVIIDYLPSANICYEDNYKLINLINDYVETAALNKLQSKEIKIEIEKIIDKNSYIKKIVKKENTFLDGVKKLNEYLMQIVNNLNSEKLHILGQCSDIDEIISYIKEYIENNECIENIRNIYINKTTFELDLINVIKDIIGDNTRDNYNELKYKIYSEIKEDCIEIYNKLQFIDLELENVLKGLNGEYIEPGLSGLPSNSLKKILPTGRNLYLMDADKIPTRQAYSVGKKLAQILIDKYIKDEGKIPEKIAMNMISTDISFSKGQQLSQILYLIGVKPIWDNADNVKGIEIIPIKELNRPRIDVAIRISGVLRDSYPNIIQLLDESISRVSSLDEDIDDNYIKKNTIYISEKLKSLDYDDIKRKSTMRIFGDKPGTYGAGVDLALKASAWENEKDIAKTFVQFSSYAYGKNLSGNFAKHEFIENIKNVDLSYEVASHKRQNILSCGFSASVHGGFNVLNKIYKGKNMKQYYTSTKHLGDVNISSMPEEIINTIDKTLLNPIWRENIKKQNYIGASEIMKKIQNIFEWQCTCESIDNKHLDMLVDTYVNDEIMREWLKRHNVYAIEELSRRFLELHQREKWNPNKDVLKDLKKNYLNLEGDMEGISDDLKGDIQGGNVEIVTYKNIENWKKKLSDFDDIF